MLRRSVLMAAVILAGTSFVATPAGASASVQDAFHGAFAEGEWQPSETSFGFTLVSREQDGTTHLSVHLFSDVALDADGNVVSGTELAGETTSGVSFSIDTVHYTAASVRGEIPVRRCAILAGTETGCADAGSVTFEASWNGIGPIPHFPDTELSWEGRCLAQVDRNSSIEREATLTVITLEWNGASIPASPTGFAGFGTGNNRLILPPCLAG